MLPTSQRQQQQHQHQQPPIQLAVHCCLVLARFAPASFMSLAMCTSMLNDVNMSTFRRYRSKTSVSPKSSSVPKLKLASARHQNIQRNPPHQCLSFTSIHTAELHQAICEAHFFYLRSANGCACVRACVMRFVSSKYVNRFTTIVCRDGQVQCNSD